VLTAVSFFSLDEVSQRRMIMGLGTGSPLVLKPQGVPFHKPLTRLWETIDVVQALIRGDAVTCRGDTIQVTEAKLDMTPLRLHIPRYLGVTGPKALELAGEKGHGVLLNAFLSTRDVERALVRVEAGAKRAGKRLAEVDMSGAVLVSVNPDSITAKDRSRRLIGLYLALFPNIAQETQLPDDLIQQVRAACNQGGPEAAAAYIDDEVVEYLTASGTPAECRRKIETYREAGVQLPILFPLDPNVHMAIETLGPLP
jgi:5,10-methylenetetrahydromethanopterin reductase